MRYLLLLALLLMGCSETGNTTDPWAENKESIRDTMWVAVDSAQYKSLLEKQDSVLASLQAQKDSLEDMLLAASSSDSAEISKRLSETVDSLWEISNNRYDLVIAWIDSALGVQNEALRALQDSLTSSSTKWSASVVTMRSSFATADSIILATTRQETRDSLYILKSRVQELSDSLRDLNALYSSEVSDLSSDLASTTSDLYRSIDSSSIYLKAVLDSSLATKLDTSSTQLQVLEDLVDSSMASLVEYIRKDTSVIDSFEDARDGHVYHTYKFNGKRWFTDPLRYYDAQWSSSTYTCSSVATCSSTISYGFSSNLCPDGYSIPRKDDFIGISPTGLPPVLLQAFTGHTFWYQGGQARMSTSAPLGGSYQSAGMIDSTFYLQNHAYSGGREVINSTYWLDIDNDRAEVLCLSDR